MIDWYIPTVQFFFLLTFLHVEVNLPGPLSNQELEIAQMIQERVPRCGGSPKGVCSANMLVHVEPSSLIVNFIFHRTI